MGVIMTAVIGYYDISNVERRTKITEDKFKVINTALVSYLARNGRLPCPAPLDCDLEGCNNDNIYDEKILGLEFRKDKDIDKECISDNNGVFESKNDVGEKLLYGNVPALSLGLDNNYLIDDWGNKLVYIVPDILTQENALKDILINQNTETRDPTISDEYVKDGEIFLLLSSNTNTQGAYAFDNRSNNDYSKTVVQEVVNEDGTTTKIEKEVNNLPEKDFKVDLNDEKYLKYHRNIDNLHDAFNAGDGSVENPDCPPIELDYNIKVDNRECQTFVFEKIGTYKNTGIPGIDGSNIGKVHEYTIPSNTEQIRIEVWGAGGGHSLGQYGPGKITYRNATAGKGGYSYGTLQIAGVDLEKAYGIKNRKLYLYVGEKGHNSNNTRVETSDEKLIMQRSNGRGGWNGGGSGRSYNTNSSSYFWDGGGGGASDVRTAKGTWDQNLDKKIIVAGGGGGASKSYNGPGSKSENGGNGGGGIGDGPNKRHSFGQNSQGYSTSTMAGLGGGRSGTNKSNPAETVTALLRGDRPLKGGGGYYAGCAAFCATVYNRTRYIESCKAEKKSYTYDNHCGGGGGGSGYVDKMFRNAGGQDGVRGSNGKIRICVTSLKGGNITHKMKFPQAKYGELSFADSICPYNIVNASTHMANISDYYTMSTFREADGTIIDNRPAIKCGSAGQWETNTDGSIKMIYECKELPKCKPAYMVNNVDKKIDWGEYDFEVTNTAIIQDIFGRNRIQCMVDKKGNANWYKIK